jgi:phosphoribosylformylglycinamidine cyclo-ligase
MIDRSTWRPQPIFGLVGSAGRIGQEELECTLNMGVGMLAVLPQSAAGEAVALLSDRGVNAWVAGEVRGGGGSVQLHGSYAA